MEEVEISRTTIDSFVEYLKLHGETGLVPLTSTFGVSADIIETWVNVLEKANIVKVTYRMGKMFVAPAAPGRK